MTEKVEVLVKFFAMARQAVGQKDMEIQVERRTKVEDLLERLIQENPELEEMRDILLVSVNKERADMEHPLEEGDEVAIMPPVTGG